MQLDRSVLEALARVRTQEPNFVKWLQSRLDKAREVSDTQRDEVLMRWTQGRNQELSDILKEMDRAVDFLRKA